MRQALRNTLWVVALLVVGCASVGLPTADTLNQRLAVGYGTVTQIAATTGQLLAAKKISAADAENIHTQAQAGKVGLDIAKGMIGGDPKAAQTKLEQAMAVISAAQSYLAAKGN